MNTGVTPRAPGAASAAQPLTTGPRHHSFGYHDKCPWDSSGRYVLALETPLMDRPPDGDGAATIVVLDTHAHDGDRHVAVARARAWNWQQGCMPHWLPTPHAIGRLAARGSSGRAQSPAAALAPLPPA